jgi:hypothetical protein
MSSFSTRIADPIKRAFESLDDRARFGLVLVGVLAGIFALSELTSANGQARQSLDAAQRQLAVRKGALEHREWASMAAEADALVASTEERFWRAATPGIAAAQVQGALEAAARNAGLRDVRVRVVETGSVEQLMPGPEIRLFEAEVTARDRGGAFAPFIEAAAGANGELRAVRLDWDARTQRFTVILIAPALLEPGT